MKDREFEDQITLKVPERFSDVLKTAARRRLTSKSQYVREAVLRKLEAGFCLLPDGDNRRLRK
jgi:hypothetical protein